MYITPPVLHIATYMSLTAPPYREQTHLSCSFNTEMASHEHHGVSNHRQLDYFFNSLFSLIVKEMSTLHITCPLWGKSTIDWQIIFQSIYDLFIKQCNAYFIRSCIKSGKWYSSMNWWIDTKIEVIVVSLTTWEAHHTVVSFPGR